jgi:hypothetical protein
MTDRDDARKQLVRALGHMERLVWRRPPNHRLSEACEVVRAEIVAFDEGGPVDRAEAVTVLAQLIADLCERR